MTESRPPGSRRADPRASEGEAANPLQRPLPPGMGRRSAERGAATPAASPFRAPTARPDSPRTGARDAVAAVSSRPAADRSVPERALRPDRVNRPAVPAGGRRRAAPEPVDSSAIPFTEPPPWQVAETAAEERQAAREREVAGQRGLPSWLGLVVLLVITGIGGLIDAVAGAGIKGAFAIGLVVGSLAAILLVRRSAMFPIVVAPPLVYFIASAVLLYVRSGGLSNRAAITDAAASWLVYGFPAIAGATAVVLIVAGVRMILHR